MSAWFDVTKGEKALHTSGGVVEVLVQELSAIVISIGNSRRLSRPSSPCEVKREMDSTARTSLAALEISEKAAGAAIVRNYKSD
jgi:hypothetical protein